MGKDFLLSHISNSLILASSNMKNLGLFNGKMGVILFFMHYARYLGNKSYQDFAFILLEELFEDVNSDMSIHFEDGLTGIGWGVEYLLQNNFLSGNALDILEDIDLKLYEYDLERISDKSLETGLAGICCYLKIHLHDKKSLMFDYLKYYESFLTKCEKEFSFDLHSFIQQVSELKENFVDWKPGLKNGCAGYGLKLIL